MLLLRLLFRFKAFSFPNHKKTECTSKQTLCKTKQRLDAPLFSCSAPYCWMSMGTRYVQTPCSLKIMLIFLSVKLRQRKVDGKTVRGIRWPLMCHLKCSFVLRANCKTGGRLCYSCWFFLMSFAESWETTGISVTFTRTPLKEQQVRAFCKWQWYKTIKPEKMSQQFSGSRLKN